jgi:glycosyltransferase involved in cell wall biosynthesis
MQCWLPGSLAGNPKFGLLGDSEKRRIADYLMTQPQSILVSVVMPTWNRAGTIQTAIKSVLAQQYKNWELHVVDDGSEDHTEEIVHAFCRHDRRIRYHRKRHEGVSDARNIGLEASSGDIIAYLDSDNAWDPDYLLFMVSKIAEGHACAYCALRIIDHDNATISHRRHPFDLKALKWHNYIDLNVFAHRRNLYTEMGGFDPMLKRWVDWDLILRYVVRYAPGLIPAALCSYHIRQDTKRISTAETEYYHSRVLNKHLVPWKDLEKRLKDRTRNHATIIIPVHNRARITENCLHSIFKETDEVDFDVVIVDNRSNYVTKAMIWDLEKQYEKLTHIENQGNYSFALGCNVGFAASKGEYVVFLNNDTIVTKTWLKQLILPLADDPSVGMVGSKLLYPDDTLQAGGMVFSNLSKVPYHIYQGHPADEPAINRQRKYAITRCPPSIILRGKPDSSGAL